MKVLETFPYPGDKSREFVAVVFDTEVEGKSYTDTDIVALIKRSDMSPATAKETDFFRDRIFSQRSTVTFETIGSVADKKSVNQMGFMAFRILIRGSEVKNPESPFRFNIAETWQWDGFFINNPAGCYLAVRRRRS
jgi:hypothetical protein